MTKRKRPETSGQWPAGPLPAELGSGVTDVYGWHRFVDRSQTWAATNSRAAKSAKRRLEAAAFRRAGMTIDKIAERMEISPRHVQRLLKPPRG